MWGHDTSNAKCDDSKGHSLKIARCARRCGTTGRSSRAGDWQLCLPEAVPRQLYACWVLQDIQHQDVWPRGLEAPSLEDGPSVQAGHLIGSSASKLRPTSATRASRCSEVADCLGRSFVSLSAYSRRSDAGRIPSTPKHPARMLV